MRNEQCRQNKRETEGDEQKKEHDDGSRRGQIISRHAEQRKTEFPIITNGV